MSSKEELITINNTKLQGCLELRPVVRTDDRGCFVKTFHKTTFQALGLPVFYGEEYYSTSSKGVLRGLHFQVPPAEHEKLVYCSYGEVFDVAVDLRKKSSTYGQYEIILLNSGKGNMLYIPKGMAHGFYVLSDFAVMMYKVTTMYVPQYDTGIRWNSIDIPWPDRKPILSERDRNFIGFEEFQSPF